MYIQNTSIKYDFINTYTYISFYQCMKNKLPFQVLFHYVIHGFREFTKEMCFALEAEFTNNALHELRRIRVFNCQMRLISFFSFRFLFFSLSMVIFSIVTVSDAVLSHVDRVPSINTVAEITFGNIYILQKD